MISRRSALRCGGFVLFAFFLMACAPLGPRPTALDRDLAVAPIPFHAQRVHQCGPAALAMLLGGRGVAVVPDELTPYLLVPGRKGALQPELLGQARRHGFIAQPIDPTLTALAAELRAGRPVLVLQNNGLGWLPRWHYAVVLGYDAARDDLLLNSGVTQGLRVPRATFEQTWQRSGRWGFVLLVPGELPYGASPERHARAIAAYEASGGGALALPAWQAARAAWPTRWEFAFGLGNRLAEDHEPAAAIAELTAATLLDPAQAAAWNNLAVALMDATRWSDALAAAETAAALSPAPAVAATLREARCQRRMPCAAVPQ